MRYAQVVIGPAGSGKVSINLEFPFKNKFEHFYAFPSSPPTVHSCKGMLKIPNVLLKSSI